jgi:hypothetical protein
MTLSLWNYFWYTWSQVEAARPAPVTKRHKFAMARLVMVLARRRGRVGFRPGFLPITLILDSVTEPPCKLVLTHGLIFVLWFFKIGLQSYVTSVDVCNVFKTGPFVTVPGQTLAGNEPQIEPNSNIYVSFLIWVLNSKGRGLLADTHRIGFFWKLYRICIIFTAALRSFS